MTSRPLYRCVTLLILLVGAGVAAAAGSASSAREDLRELRLKIQALQKRLADAKESKAEAADALRDSERAISDANRNLRRLGQESRAANARLAALRGESTSKQAVLSTQQALLARMLYQRYVSGRPEPLRLLFNRENPNRIARDLRYFGYLSRARGDLIGDLRANLARLDQLTREAGQKVAELKAISVEQASQKQRLEGEKRARGLVLAKISREIRKQRAQIGTWKRDESRLTRLIEQLGRIISRSRSRPYAPPRLKNERLPDATTDGTPFQQLKGRLALPVRGELGNRFGSPREDGGPVWKGLFIACKAGADVHAIAAGRVVFADWLRGFGNLLIIDHGDSYMSLYGNNEALYKQVGDSIRAGETIAAAGNSGGNADSGLYFEIRYQGKPFDPLTWVHVK